MDTKAHSCKHSPCISVSRTHLVSGHSASLLYFMMYLGGKQSSATALAINLPTTCRKVHPHVTHISFVFHDVLGWQAVISNSSCDKFTNNLQKSSSTFHTHPCYARLILMYFNLHLCKMGGKITGLPHKLLPSRGCMLLHHQQKQFAHNFILFNYLLQFTHSTSFSNTVTVMTPTIVNCLGWVTIGIHMMAIKKISNLGILDLKHW